MLRPHDLLLLLAVAARKNEPFRVFADLARQTGVSIGEVHKALGRAEAAGLYRANDRRVATEALAEFLVHGARYAFPAVPGPIVRGVPTGVAAPPLDDAFGGAGLRPEQTPVWPSPDGARRGYQIEPLYTTVPQAATADAALYELLALTDALRDGRPREREAAEAALHERLFDAP